jgi:polyphenol oxidase
VKTADCLPILLVDERRRAVGAVHAGWRGTVSRVAISTLRAMSTWWGTRPEDLHAAIGPGIGKCCFEVGPEVAVQFGEPADRAHIDLEAANCRQLVEAGLAPERIYSSGLCTFCSHELFHSFRRDREQAGRMHSGRESELAPAVQELPRLKIRQRRPIRGRRCRQSRTRGGQPLPGI